MGRFQSLQLKSTKGARYRWLLRHVGEMIAGIGEMPQRKGRKRRNAVGHALLILDPRAATDLTKQHKTRRTNKEAL